MKRSKKIAVAAILSALGTVIVLLGSVFSVLDLTLVSLAAFTVMIAVIELGGGWPWLVWAVTSALALILCPDKSTALEYLLFGGVYPIAKCAFERFHPVVTWVLKLSYFNTALIIFIFIAKYVLHYDDEPVAFQAAVFALANLYFVLFDLLMTAVSNLYLVKLRKKLGLGDFFRNP